MHLWILVSINGCGKGFDAGTSMTPDDSGTLVPPSENDMRQADFEMEHENFEYEISEYPELDGIIKDQGEILFADPTVYVENGKYYLTGTSEKGLSGFAVLVSVDLKKWYVPLGGPHKMILEKGGGAFGNSGFWAPQMLKDAGKYYLTYTADGQVSIASSESLTGPYTQRVIRPIDDYEGNIDSFLFKDDNGKYYLYHVRFENDNHICVAEFDLDKGHIKGKISKCLSYSESWEKTLNFNSNPVLEGPSVVKWDGVYYMFYSANHFMNIDYAIGYATADNPLGPWKKHSGNPIIHRSVVGENGSGHGDIFKGLDGRYYYVYHVHNSNKTVGPRKTRIVPLNMTKGSDGIYIITADASNVIIPVQVTY